MSMRGTMTSWTRRSPSSMTALIICSSSASRIALLPAALDDQAELLGRDLGVARDLRAEQPGDPAGDPRQERDDRPEHPAQEVDGQRQGEREAFRVGQRERLRHELTEDDREQREDDRDDDEGDPLGRPSSMPRSSVVSPSDRLTAAYADAKNPTKVRPSWMTARNRPGSSMRRRTRRAPRTRSSTSCSIRLRRIVMRAISAATKTPSRMIRIPMTSSSPNGRLTPLGSLRRVGPGLARSSRERPRRACRPERPRVTTAPAPVLASSPTAIGRDEHRVDAEERPVADRGPVLALPVVVGSDGACADVGVVTDLGVAEVAHVVLFDAGAEAGVLELGEVADLRAATDRRSRAEGG